MSLTLFAKAKVCNLDIALCVQEQIVQLQIPADPIEGQCYDQDQHLSSPGVTKLTGQQAVLIHGSLLPVNNLMVVQEL